MKKKMLILGASGFIGKNCVEHFLKLKKYNIEGTYFKNRPNLNIKLYKLDLRSEKNLKKIFKNKDIIIQAAASTSGAKDIINKPFIHVNDNAIINSVISKVAYETEVPHIINFSCTIMYPNSNRPLKENEIKFEKIFDKYFGAAWMKLFVEKKCEFYSRFKKNKYTLIRHSNIYGKHDKFDLERSHVFGATITKVLKSKKNFIEVWGDGKEKRNFLFIEDLLNFIELAINKQSEYFKLYNLGANKSISIKDLVKKIIKVSQKKISIKFLKSKPTLKTNININSSKAKKELKWKQKYDLEFGIKKTIDWYNKNIL